MKTLAVVARAIAVLLLAGCSSAPPGPPQDPTLARLRHAGDTAFEQEQPAQAAVQYRAALEQARIRDDAGAIANAGFNLAAAQLRAGKPMDALRTAEAVRVELARRGIADADFDLISATALYRMGNLSAADAAAAGLTGNKNPALADAAWFLRGLIADQHGDRPGLAHALASLTPAASPADVAELKARASGDPAEALHAADLRRDRLDYRGMARALALAARLTRSTSQAADLYLRAGRSAAGQGDTEDARLWLAQAQEISPDPGLRAAATQALAAIDKPPGSS
ncbi:MAG TPA: hypothetical protein VL574_13270 [Stellaceae bacterium]|jgi:tetratricopeptide (TPR) repeat protein|nr:hypothetical protein [Stellaceae bacterium]